MIENIVSFASAWWGLLTVLLFIIVFALLRWEQFKAYATQFILLAEERARQKALQTGQEKFQWVVTNGLLYMPTKLKIFITFFATIMGTTREELFGRAVQWLFDKVFTWAEAQELRPLKE